MIPAGLCHSRWSPIADETLQPGDVREYTAEESLVGRETLVLSPLLSMAKRWEIGKLGIPKDFSFVR